MFVSGRQNFNYKSINCISLQNTYFTTLKLLYHAGEVLPAYRTISRAAGLLGLHEPEAPQSSWFARIKILIKFMWFWRNREQARSCHFLLVSLVWAGWQIGITSLLYAHHFVCKSNFLCWPASVGNTCFFSWNNLVIHLILQNVVQGFNLLCCVILSQKFVRIM